MEGLEAVNSNSPYIRSAVQQHGDVDAFQKNARQAFRLSATVGPRIEGGIVSTPIFEQLNTLQN